MDITFLDNLVTYYCYLEDSIGFWHAVKANQSRSHAFICWRPGIKQV